MSFAWQDLHGRLLATSTRRSFHLRLRAMAAHVPELVTFRDIQDFLQHQHGTTAPSEARDAVVRSLVVMLQGRPADRELAVHLMLLALWPGLDAMRWRLRRYWRGEPDELAAEIAGGLIVQADRADLAAVHRVAATLLLNLERDLRRAWMRDAQRGRETVPLDTTDAPPEAGFVDTLAGSPDDQPDAQLAAKQLLDRLGCLLGEDAALVLAVRVNGHTHAEAGKALGLTPDATRKRVQRALKRLSTVFEEF